MPSTTTKPSSATPRLPLGGLTQLADQARSWWESAPVPTRVISVGLALLVALCLCGAVMMATAPTYEDLFTNLDPKDAAAIAAKLDESHEKYQMADGDTAVRVPSADKDRLRMEMIQADLPAKTGGVVGSDWLKQIGLGTTSAVQDQYIRMAEEGELSQTISSMNEVSSAAVHLSPGSDSPFADNSTPPSASVVIGIKSGMSLTPDQIEGIANLVAKSVPGLDLKNVALVDSDGNQLWPDTQQAGAGGSSSSRMNSEAEASESLRTQIQSTFDKVLGAGKALVSVHEELNFDQVHSVGKQIVKGAPLSSQTGDEEYAGSGSPSGGAAAGIAANTPGGSVPQYSSAGGSTGKSGTYKNSTETDNYQNGEVDTDTDKAPGAVERLAVAVLVDSSVPQATVTALQATCAAMAGATSDDKTRTVSVQSVPFSNVDFKNQQALLTSVQSQARMQEILKVAAVAVVAIVLLMMFMRSTKSAAQNGAARRRGTNPPSQYSVTEDRDALDALGYTGDPGQMPGDGSAASGRQRLSGDPSSQYDNRAPSARHRAGASALAADEPMSIEAILDDIPANPSRRSRRAQREIPEIEQQMDMKLESIREMVKQQPKSVALLMKGWMTDAVDSD